jgi:hypothetical protein
MLGEARFMIVGSGMWRKANIYFGARPGIDSREDITVNRIGLLTRGSGPLGLHRRSSRI